MTQQAKLDQACKDASGEGVGFVGAINKDGTVTIRRDEEFAASHTHHFDSLQAALTYLAEYEV